MLRKREFANLLHWIRQRELARSNKTAGLNAPYCDDEVINTYRFCNVIRMDDRVSQWLLDHWYAPNMGNTNQWFACAVARYLNWPDTLMRIGYPVTWNPPRALRKLNAIDGKTFSAAYIIPAPGGTRKIEHVINNVLTPLYERRELFNSAIPNWTSMEKAHARLQSAVGFGSFLAGQVVADWRHAGVFRGVPQDVLTWAPLGPGSTRGINRLLGREATAGIPKTEAHSAMFEAFVKTIAELDHPVVERMELMDFQNCLCEFDKYMRTLNAEGTPKVRYVPNRGY
jgi:hypothetical protein